MASLKWRPRNWKFHWPYELTNEIETMTIWSGNGDWGLHFTIDGRMRGGVCVFRARWIRWRQDMMQAVDEAFMNPWVKKYGIQWDKKK